MSHLIWVLISVAAILGMVRCIMRRHAEPGGGQRKYDDGTGVFVPPVTSNFPATRRRVYHGALFEPGFDSCAAADRLRGERYLPNDAPALPLPACDKSECTCLIQPTKDRRSAGARRGEDMGMYAGEDDVIVSVRKEHRVRKDRRGC